MTEAQIPIQTALDVMRAEATAITQLSESLDHSAFVQICERILASTGRVLLTGVGKSGLIGAKIAATLASTGTPAHFVHTADAGHGDLGMVNPGDVVIALSNSGQSREFIPLTTYCARRNIPIVAVTANANSHLAKAASILALLPKIAEGCPLDLAPMTSTTMQLAWGDALAAVLIRARGFARNDFALRHMGGSLGLRTKTVAEYLDELATGSAELPVQQLIDINDNFLAISTAISQGRVGAVLVTDKSGNLQPHASGLANIAGIITDGNVRRAIAKGLTNPTAAEIMTPHPVAVPDSMLLVDAVEEMKSRRINVLAATNPNKPVRLVHIQDLLNLGL